MDEDFPELCLRDPELAEIPAEERSEAEEYARRAYYKPGTGGYYDHQRQSMRVMELPDLLEDGRDQEEAAKKYSRRVRAYIPWKLARDWGSRHHTARSASELMQEAMRAELDRTPLPQACPDCGGTATYQGLDFLDGADGESAEIFFEVYTCTTCGKSHSDVVQESSTHALFHPRALEERELWQHDEGVTWVESETRKPGEYTDARDGLLLWWEYEKARRESYVEDPQCKKYLEAHEGRKKWDQLMTKYVEQQFMQNTDL